MIPRRLLTLAAVLAALAVLAWAIPAGLEWWRARRAGQAGAAAQRAEPVVIHDIARVDSVLRVDTVTARVTRTRYDTLRVLDRVTDTVWVRATIAAADTAVRACSAALLTCAERARLADSLAALRLTRIRALEAGAKGPRLTKQFGATYEALGATAGHWQVDAGAALRLAGPLSAVVRAEQPVGVPGARPRVTVGASWRF